MKKDPVICRKTEQKYTESSPFPPVGSRIHFIGICGSSMSGLALLVKHYGYIVSGSDKEAGTTADILRNSGINVII